MIISTGGFPTQRGGRGRGGSAPPRGGGGFGRPPMGGRGNGGNGDLSVPGGLPFTETNNNK